MTTTLKSLWFENKVEVSRCSLMDFELSSKRPGQRKFLCWTGWGIDCWYRSKTCKKKVSKKLIPWMLRLLWQIISLFVTKGTEILQLNLLCISLTYKLTGCCFKLDRCIQLLFAGPNYSLFFLPCFWYSSSSASRICSAVFTSEKQWNYKLETNKNNNPPSFLGTLQL